MIKNADSCLIGNVYIGGPITGIENWQDNFLAAEKELLECTGAFFCDKSCNTRKKLRTAFCKAWGNARLYGLYEDFKQMFNRVIWLKIPPFEYISIFGELKI